MANHLSDEAPSNTELGYAHDDWDVVAYEAARSWALAHDLPEGTTPLELAEYFSNQKLYLIKLVGRAVFEP